MASDQILSRREQFREKYLNSFPYSGYGHWFLTVVLIAGVVLFGGYLLSWPGFSFFGLVFYSLFEYFYHRFPEHRRIKGFFSLYRFHTLEHHQLFDQDHMEVDSHKDFAMILFPPIVTLFLLVIYFPLLAFILFFLTSSILLSFSFFVALALGYLFYEIVHFASHHSESSIFYRIPVLAPLCRNHRKHHNWTKMSKSNFGIITTAWDYVFRSR